MSVALTLSFLVFETLEIGRVILGGYGRAVEGVGGVMPFLALSAGRALLIKLFVVELRLGCIRSSHGSAERFREA